MQTHKSRNAGTLRDSFHRSSCRPAQQQPKRAAAAVQDNRLGLWEASGITPASSTFARRLARELYQTEWCPASRRVREHLTELAVDYLIHQVPVARDHRAALVAATGAATIPTLRLENGTAIVGEEAIELYLAEHFDEPPEAKEHRLKAATAHRRFLEEECECSQLVTH